jgi:asparagine synthase (glutamine-hydrolysing)
MCGIGGILRVWPAEQRERALAMSHAESIPEAWLDILDASIRHRGPDGQGRFRDRAIRADGSVVDVALVHRRLSIIDHACGAQPMVSSLSLGAGSFDELPPPSLFHGKPNEPVVYRAMPNASRDLVAVVFNGCIYNHRDLRAQLQREGHVFTTDHSDTEVLVHGWREWGREAVWVPTPHEPVPCAELFGNLDGMYAAAVWDRANGVLSLARDRCGEKPLYILDEPDGAERPSLLAFSSCISGLYGLQRALGRDTRINHDDGASFWHWLRFGWAQANFIEGVRELGRGADESFPESVFGGPMFSWLGFGSRDPTAPQLSTDRLDGLLAAAVRERLEADVPLGVFLSGGVDSALLSVYARQALGGLSTYTVRMPDARYDESEPAAIIAARIGTDHTTLDCHPNPTHDLPGAIQQLGLPFGDSSLLPALWVSHAAKQHVAVALSGDGGDELFLGYERYKAANWLAQARPLLALAWLVTPSSSDPRSRRSKLKRLGAAARAAGYDDLLAIFSATEYRAITRDRRGHLPIAVSRFPSRTGDNVAKLRAIDDLRSYLPYDILRKSDTASMRVALEVRAPFLSWSVIRAATGASSGELMPRGQRKGLLRQVARKYLPAEIVDRPKMGFAIPIGEWFRSDYGGLRTMLLDHLNSTEPFGPPSLGIDLNMKFVRQMLDEHLGTGPSGVVKRDHSQRLYMLLVLSIWAKWMGGLR